MTILKVIGCFILGGLGYLLTGLIEPCRPWSDIILLAVILILARSCYKHSTSPLR